MKTKLILFAALSGLMLIYSCKKEEEDPVVRGYNENGMWGYTPDLYHISVEAKKGPAALLYGFIDRTGTVAIVPVFVQVGDFSFDLASVTTYVDGVLTEGYINTNGQLVIPYTYKYCSKFTSSGLASVTNFSDKQGYIDRTGNLQIPCMYDFADKFHEGLAPVESGGLYGAINTEGTLVIPMIYNQVSIFNEGYARVRNAAEKFGFIDKNNNLVVDYTYELAGYFVNGLSWAISGGKMGYIRPDGSVAIPFSFDWGGSFWEDLAYVKSGGMYGFIDKTGAYAVDLLYTDAEDFSEGLAAVEKDNDLWGYIDYSGNTILPHQYELAWPFVNGIAKVVFQDFAYGYIDKAGNVIWKSDSKAGAAILSGGHEGTAEELLQASLMQK